MWKGGVKNIQHFIDVIYEWSLRRQTRGEAQQQAGPKTARKRAAVKTATKRRRGSAEAETGPPIWLRRGWIWSMRRLPSDDFNLLSNLNIIRLVNP